MTEPEAAAATGEVTSLLRLARDGNRAAFDRLFAAVYRELRRVAGRQMRRERDDHTLYPTALVHEAYLRLVDAPAPHWSGRAHFRSVAARAMRQVLLDYAKRRGAAKREGGRQRITLDALAAGLHDGAGASDVRPDAILALDESLERLARHDPRQSRIVECRFFGGMSIDETAEALGISPATVKRGWAMAQAWLYRDLAESADAPA